MVNYIVCTEFDDESTGLGLKKGEKEREKEKREKRMRIKMAIKFSRKFDYSDGTKSHHQIEF